jgi:hypothetical protein
VTNEELLVAIEMSSKSLTNDYGFNALKAVVELHKPYEPTQIGTVCKACGITADYPCSTIQAIEKELM